MFPQLPQPPGLPPDNFQRPPERAFITLPRWAVIPLILVGLILVGLALRAWLIGFTNIDLIRGVNMFLALLLIPLGYDLTRRILSSTIGLIVAALLAIGMPFVEPLLPILGESLLLSMLCAYLWLLVCWRDSYRARTISWPWLAAAGVALAVAALVSWPVMYVVGLAVGLVAAESWLGLTGRQPMARRTVPTRDHTQFVGIRQPDRFADPARATRRSWPVGRWLLSVVAYVLVLFVTLTLTVVFWAIRNVIA
jgi:hypothetical protein